MCFVIMFLHKEIVFDILTQSCMFYVSPTYKKKQEKQNLTAKTKKNFLKNFNLNKKNFSKK